MKRLTGRPDLNQQLTEEQKRIFASVQEAEAKRKEPREVAEAAFHFLSSDSPRLRYMVAQSEERARLVIRAMLDRTLQLNASQPTYTLSRDALVKLLDEVLAEQASRKK